jgi:hypothetical protein
MLIRENEQLVQNKKKHSQAKKLDIHKYKTTIRKKNVWSVYDTVQDNIMSKSFLHRT